MRFRKGPEYVSLGIVWVFIPSFNSTVTQVRLSFTRGEKCEASSKKRICYKSGILLCRWHHVCHYNLSNVTWNGDGPFQVIPIALRNVSIVSRTYRFILHAYSQVAQWRFSFWEEMFLIRIFFRGLRNNGMPTRSVENETPLYTVSWCLLSHNSSQYIRRLGMGCCSTQIT